jgi:hypothetical protein
MKPTRRSSQSSYVFKWNHEHFNRYLKRVLRWDMTWGVYRGIWDVYEACGTNGMCDFKVNRLAAPHRLFSTPVPNGKLNRPGFPGGSNP